MSKRIADTVKWPCGSCCKECVDGSVICDLCNRWFHHKCEGLVQKQLRQLGGLPDEYLCLKCTHVNTQFDYTASCERLTTASTLGIGRLRYAAKLEAILLRVYPDFTTPVRYMANIDRDEISHAILRRYGSDKDVMPVRVAADGNCLFNSLSVAVSGDESRSMELRVRTCIEMTMYEQMYRDKWENTPIHLISPDYEDALIECAKDASYSSSWTILALASVVQRDIMSVYPPVNGLLDTSLGILNTTFVARQQGTAKQNPVRIMWTSSAKISASNSSIWQPNHFVPLLFPTIEMKQHTSINEHTYAQVCSPPQTLVTKHDSPVKQSHVEVIVCSPDHSPKVKRSAAKIRFTSLSPTSPADAKMESSIASHEFTKQSKVQHSTPVMDKSELDLECDITLIPRHACQERIYNVTYIANENADVVEPVVDGDDSIMDLAVADLLNFSVDETADILADLVEEPVVAQIFISNQIQLGDTMAEDEEPIAEARLVDILIPDDVQPVREMYAADLGAYVIPQQLDESELEDDMPSPRPVVVSPGRVTYTMVEESSIRGKDLLIDSYGYRYTLKVDKRRTAITWRCTARAKPFMCKAVVHERDGDYIRGVHIHVCCAQPGRDKVAVICRDAKQQAKKRIFDSATDIVDGVIREIAPGRQVGMCPTIPKVPNLAKQLNYLRKNMRPKDPTHTGFELAYNHLPENFLRSDIHEGNHRHIILASDDMMDQLARANTWYMDATFKVVRQPFSQLFSIHGFVKSNDCLKQIPLAFILMSSRRTVDYNMVFRALCALMPRMSLRKCVADYEAALWQSVRATLPGIPQQGCLFHYTQAVYRKLQELGLQRAYVDDEGTRKLCRRFMALPLLPHEHIVASFEHLLQMIGPLENDALRQMAAYMRMQWVDGRVFKPVDWTVFGMTVRTNNDVEGWHYHLNHKAKRGQLPLYNLIHLLYTEADLVSRTIVLVQREDLTRRQRAGAKDVNDKLEELWRKYNHQERTAMQLLAEGAHLICPNPERAVDGNVFDDVV